MILLAAAAAFLVLGAVRGQLREPGGLTLQAAGMFAFGAIALAALYVAPEAGVYLVALALFGHAAWDTFHYLKDRVVTRPYAEFCGVLDLVLSVVILVLA
jgi:stage V sporulation protein SpoVS